MAHGRNTFAVAAALLAMLAVTSHAALLASERPAVQAMLDAWAPAGWGTNVAVACGPPAWPGLHCDFGDTSVTQVLLGKTLLDGTIPGNLNLLTNLEVLDLQQANLTGPIPATLFSLTKLANVYLNDNGLTEAIPSPAGLTAIIDLYLHNNSLTGEIPAGFGAKATLKVLSVHHNELTGGVPADLANSTGLTEFHAGYNQLTGGIPENLGDVTTLTFLDLGMNQGLGGPIPESFSKLVNMRLLYLQHCGLTGDFPASLGNMTHLELVWLFDNNLNLCPPPAWTQVFHDGTCEAGNQGVVSCSSGCAQGWEAAGCHTAVDPSCAPFVQTPQAAAPTETTPESVSPDAPADLSPDAPADISPDAPAEPTTNVPVDVPSSGFQVAPAVFFTLAVAAIAVFYL